MMNPTSQQEQQQQHQREDMRAGEREDEESKLTQGEAEAANVHYRPMAGAICVKLAHLFAGRRLPWRPLLAAAVLLMCAVVLLHHLAGVCRQSAGRQTGPLLISGHFDKSQPVDSKQWLLFGMNEDDINDDHHEESNQENQNKSFTLLAAKHGRANDPSMEAESGKNTDKQLVRSRRRVAQPSLIDKGKPILNEFSFPPNLVQGMRFVLMCQVLDGEPPIQIKWFKDGRELDTGQSAATSTSTTMTTSSGGGGGGSYLNSNISPQQTETSQQQQQQQQPQNSNMEVELISSDELGSSLVFRKVKAHHTGNYTCLAANHFGSTSFSSFMSVKVPPKWRFEPQDQQSIMGEQITIDCQASGNPNPFIRWKFTSGQLFHHLQQQQQQQPTQMGRLQNLAPAAADLSPQASRLIDAVAAAAGQIADQSDTNAGALQFQQQQQQLLTGQLLANFKLINSNHHVQTLENGSLSIRQTSKEQHEGLYLCEADNGVEPSLIKLIRLEVRQQAHFLQDIQVSLHGPTSVQSEQAGQGSNSSSASNNNNYRPPLPASTTNYIRTVRLAQNSSLVRLLCEPLGDLPLQVDWLKDGRLIHSHSTGGSTSVQSQQQQQQLASSPSELHQQLAGRYYVNTKWTGSSSSPSSSSMSPSNRQQHLESELTLVNVARQDAGMFTCLARNAYGQAERKLRLVVQEPPEPPSLVDVAHISSRSISLRWLAPFDGNSAILKYVVEYRKLPPSGTDQQQQQQQQADLSAIARSEKMMAASGDQLEVSSSSLSVVAAAAAAANGDDPANQANQISHTIHELEPMARYSLRVVAVNALGQSRPSVALSLRTEEEVPATVPSSVEAQVLTSRSIKLRWTITYSPEHELIDGFFVGYRSFDASSILAADAQQVAASAPTSSAAAAKQAQDRPTFTYKTIRLTNAAETGQSMGATDKQQQEAQSAAAVSSTPPLSPVSSVTKTVPMPNQNSLGLPPHQQTTSSPAQRQQVVVVSSFEYVINALDRNTEYTILIQCFNKKGAGPTSDPVVFKTFMSDPPEKLSLVAEEVSESSIKVSWQFPGENLVPMLVSGNALDLPTPPEASLGHHPHHQLHRTANQQYHTEQVDGFVLTFSRMSPRPLKLPPQMASTATSIPTTTPTTTTTTTTKPMPDSAARISLQPNQQLAHLFDHNHQWQAVQLGPQQRRHLLKNLECGSWYAMKIWAFNKMGKGEPSELVTVSTRGKAPIAPDRRSFLSINSTQARLHLAAWNDGGCEIDKFVVQYRARGQQEWILVSNNILREQNSVVIRDLNPATSYELLVGAQNQVALTEARYRLTTLDVDGKQVAMSHSFFGSSFTSSSATNNDLGEDNITVDYTDEFGQTRREVWPNGNNNIGSSSPLVPSASGRWILLARQILNSPITLLFALCLFLVLLVLLIFHRVNEPAASRSPGSSTGTLASSCNKSSSQTSGYPDANTSGMMLEGCRMDGPPLQPPPAPSMSLGPGESPPAFTDLSPSSHVNLSGSHRPVSTAAAPPSASGGVRHQMDGQPHELPPYAGDFYGSSSPYCSHQQPQQQIELAVAGDCSSGPAYFNCNPASGGHQHQHLSANQNYYALPAAYASVHRSATMEPSNSLVRNGHHQLNQGQDHNLIQPMGFMVDQQQQQQSRTQSEDERQQYLMQMLMLSPHQHQHQTTSTATSTTATGHQDQLHDSAAYNVAAALTTLARQKSGALKAASMGSNCNYLMSANMTLGRQPNISTPSSQEDPTTTGRIHQPHV